VKRPLLALPFALLALASGCGSSDAGGNVDKSDIPGSALACLESNDIQAQRTGKDDDELVLDAGPRVKFFLTADEAIAEQFRGRREGTEQIGTALLYVEPETSKQQDDILHDVEVCLSDL
jgi:hypothetical protein